MTGGGIEIENWHRVETSVGPELEPRARPASKSRGTGTRIKNGHKRLTANSFKIKDTSNTFNDDTGEAPGGKLVILYTPYKFCPKSIHSREFLLTPKRYSCDVDELTH
ncbi:hypothetical protein EVAR_82821_1 [Eumeta japonica]|uniref:Uncharacterized protein n=1 Tax=Eumeta variegata TaxID=151549 RepID=A0A4C1V4Q0_EUMVA|nr:hypothetical protein EVAR_82821_1 [Eumeta japonica]